MRHLLGFVCVCALGVVPLVGCSETGETEIACEDNVCPCNEGGIRGAIAEGGGPFTFDCDGPTTVFTKAEIDIDKDVILHGEGNLAVHGNDDHRVFEVGAAAELRGITVTGGHQGAPSMKARRPGATLSTGKSQGPWPYWGGGIANYGTLALTNCTVSGNTTSEDGGGIHNDGTLTLTNTTVSGNTAWIGGGLGGGQGVNLYSTLTLINSTVSGNTSFEGPNSGIFNAGTLTLINSAVSGDISFLGTLTSTSSLIDGVCEGRSTWEAVSNGYNIESPGNTCGFDQSTDMPGMTAEQLNLGPLADKDGPTMTHNPGDGGLGEGSIAIDAIPGDACEVDTDQRGEPRPEAGGTMCDVGSVERQPTDSN